VGRPHTRRSGRGRSGRPRPKPAPDHLGGDQVEGRRAVRELLAAGRRRVRDLWVSHEAGSSPALDEIVGLAAAARVPVRRVTPEQLQAAARTEAPQGVLARAEPLPVADLVDLARAQPGRPPPFLVVLDGVTDPHNLGALLRTMECAGATGAVVPRHRAAHVTPAAAKGASGAVEHVPIAVVPGVPGALAELRRAGVWTVGLDAGASQSVFDLSVATEPLALVLGAEGTGLSRLARERCDVVVAIPLRGALPSLNVAAAGAVACYEVARRRLT
jgi:23S rRNA (guanosine2251-2'-O)-methyltransferase